MDLDDVVEKLETQQQQQQQRLTDLVLVEIVVVAVADFVVYSAVDYIDDYGDDGLQQEKLEC